MNASPRLVAIVPMRHHSERVPGKNYRKCAGKPLYRHIVESLLDCPQVERVFIDTDSPTILADAQEIFPEVQLYERPLPLRGGNIPMNTVLLNDVQQVNADFYLQTHSTNPLLSSATIGRAIESFLASWPEKDSLFTVTRLQTRLWDSSGRPINHDPAVLLRTQDLPPVFEENSSLYLFTADSLRRHGNRIGAHPLMFPIDRDEAWDIDEEIDFFIAEQLCLRSRPPAGDEQPCAGR